MKNLSELTKTWVDFISKSNETALHQIQQGMETFQSVKLTDVEKAVKDQTQKTTSALKESAQSLLALQVSAQAEVVKQLEKTKTEYSAAFVENYKKAVSTYESLVKEAIAKLPSSKA